MLLHKWDYESHTYKPFESPAKKPMLFMPHEMLDELVDCANCGKEVIAGETYTSKTIHTNLGLGYGVCESCYDKEIKESKIKEK